MDLQDFLPKFNDHFDEMIKQAKSNVFDSMRQVIERELDAQAHSLKQFILNELIDRQLALNSNQNSPTADNDNQQPKTEPRELIVAPVPEPALNSGQMDSNESDDVKSEPVNIGVDSAREEEQELNNNDQEESNDVQIHGDSDTNSSTNQQEQPNPETPGTSTRRSSRVAKRNQTSTSTSSNKKQRQSTFENDDDDDDTRSNRYKTIHLKCITKNCDKTFPNKHKLDEHLERRHQIYRYRCLQPGCNQSFHHCARLTDHVSDDHPNPEWKCTKCDQEFANSATFQVHVSKYHYEGLFACTEARCTFTGTTRQAVNYHHYNTHGRFTCFECGQSFRDRYTLTTHQRRHTGEKPYRCKYFDCEESFAEYTRAINHVRTWHFSLPKTKKEQKAQNIRDDRDPAAFIEIQVQEILNE